MTISLPKTAAALALSLLILMLASAGAAHAAPPPDCAAPASLDVSVTPNPPASIYDTLTFAVSGTTNDTCAVVAIPDGDLTVKTVGTYEMPDGAGQMIVSGNTATFVIDPAFAASHATPYAFSGLLRVGVKSESAFARGYQPFTISFQLAGMAQPVTIDVPGCDSCTRDPVGLYKWSELDDATGIVSSGIILGADQTPAGDHTATIADTLGPGQICEEAALNEYAEGNGRVTQSTPVACPAADQPQVVSATFAPVSGRAYALTVSARVVANLPDGYSDTGTIAIDGGEIFNEVVLADRHDGAAGSGGGNRRVTPGPGPGDGGPGAKALAPRLSISLRPGRRIYRSGQAVSHRITVSAAKGGADARNVRVCAARPKGLEYRRKGRARLSRRATCWTVARLKAGTRRTFTFKTRAVKTRATRRIKTRVTVRATGVRARAATATITVKRAAPAAKRRR